MYCFNLKNQLGFISLAILASSSSLLAMDAMEVEFPYVAHISVHQNPNLTVTGVQVVTTAIIMDPLSTAKRKSTERGNPLSLSNQENYPPQRSFTRRPIQTEETRDLQQQLKNARQEIQILETTLDEHRVNFQGIRTTYEDEIQALKSALATYQNKFQELSTQLQTTKTTNQAQIQELETRLQSLGELYQANFQALEKTVETDQTKFQVWKEQHNETQIKNKELEEKLRYTEAKCQELDKKMMVQESTPPISPELFHILRLKNQAAETKNLSLHALVQTTLTEKQTLRNELQKATASHYQVVAENQQLKLELQGVTSSHRQVIVENQQLKLELQDAKNRLQRQYPHTPYISNVGQYGLAPTTGSHPSFSQWGSGYATNQPIQSNFVFPGSRGENPQRR